DAISRRRRVVLHCVSRDHGRKSTARTRAAERDPYWGSRAGGRECPGAQRAGRPCGLESRLGSPFSLAPRGDKARAGGGDLRGRGRPATGAHTRRSDRGGGVAGHCRPCSSRRPATTALARIRAPADPGSGLRNTHSAGAIERTWTRIATSLCVGGRAGTGRRPFAVAPAWARAL